MNTNHWLRTLILDRQAELYGSVSEILPPQVSVRRGAGEWNLKAFEWAPCEGAGAADSARLPALLAARSARINALLA
jgi:hypothetical protein